MRDLASSMSSFSGSAAALVRVLRFEGFGGRREGEAMVVAADARRSGSVLSGLADRVIAALDVSKCSLVAVPVGDAEAVESGLACGGTAQLLVQPIAGIPAEVWSTIAAREPFVLVTRLDGGSFGCSTVVMPDLPAGLPTGLPTDVIEAAKQHLRSGKSTTTTFESGGSFHFETVSPPPKAVVVGTAELARAIERQGALLGWTCEIIDERVPDGIAIAAKAAADLGPVDALVALSHDIEASCAAIASALRGRCGYVGALGSRHTQGARRDHLLTVEKLSAETADRVHGPIGLDLGSRTPEETALAIFAEVLAVRRGRTASSLKSSTTPIH
jgi:xanthine dehydrogenase accessory factor